MPRKRPAPKAKAAKTEPNELAETISACNKNYGKNTMVKARAIIRPSMISTGIFLLDMCTLGGIPQSRLTQLAGVKHGGKSMVTAKTLAAAQKRHPDKVAVLVDTEQTSDPIWMEKLGVDVDKLQVAYCDTGEQAIDLTDALIRSKETSIVALDSMAALTSTKEIDAAAGDHLVAQQAGMVTRMAKAMTSAFSAERRRGHNPAVLVTNQLRSDLNGFARFGEATKVTGGRALGHHISLNIVLKNKEVAGKDQYGTDSMAVNEMAFRIDKNKLCAGLRQGEYRMFRYHDSESGLDEGDIDNAPTMLVYAKRMGLYAGGGSSWRLTVDGVERKFKKAAEAIAMLNQDRDIQWLLRNELIALQASNLHMPTNIVEDILATPNLLTEY